MAKIRTLAPPKHTVTRSLAAVAGGREVPDAVLSNAQVLDVNARQVHAERELWVTAGRIARICRSGTATSAFGKGGPSVYDCQGALLAPGLCDPHMHVESSKVTVHNYAETALLNGTTTVFADSHEIANVLGIEGIRMMIADGMAAPLNFYATVPSTVPATAPETETAGADLTPEVIGLLMDEFPEVILALGEAMNYPAILAGDARQHGILAEALKRGLAISGHVYGRENVPPYAASGVGDTHEAIDGEIAADLVRAGMWVFLRSGPPGSAWDSLPEAIKAITQHGLSDRLFCLCTDDRSPNHLLSFGMDYAVFEAVSEGLDPLAAWTMGSLHPALRYGVEEELGSLGLSRQADIVLLDIQAGEFQARSRKDLSRASFRPVAVWLAGEQVVEEGQPTERLKRRLDRCRADVKTYYPSAAFQTVNIPEATPPLLPPMPKAGRYRVNVLRILPPGILTGHEALELEIEEGQPFEELLRHHDLTAIASLERHHKTGRVGHGVVKGFGIKEGAIASSIAHDAHNLLVIGDNEADMKRATEEVRRQQGGICVFSRGQLLAQVVLPVAGLMCTQSVAETAARMDTIAGAMRSLGCSISFMEFSLLALAVIPELRVTDRGLISTTQAPKIIPLFEPAS